MEPMDLLANTQRELADAIKQLEAINPDFLLPRR